MSIINNILELALKKNINTIDPNKFGDPVLDTLKSSVNSAVADVAGVQSPATIPYYGGYSIPAPSALMQNPTGVITVGSAPYNTAAGTACTWTVPAGATQAQFQIWGAGGNGSACDWGTCCGYAQSGGNGEYTYVRMSVTPGQKFTLCAGGGNAVSTNSCYSYGAFDGCNSFVCGDNSTCILSCGGLQGFQNMCGTCVRENYPSAGNNYATAVAGVYVQTNHFQCQQYFSKPTYRNDGAYTGGITSSNKITAITKIPSLVWGTAQCGNSLCYMCQYTYTVLPTHAICKLSAGWSGYEYSGCCAPSNFPQYRLPGVGGPGATASCYQGPTYGACGNQGLVIVSYK